MAERKFAALAGLRKGEGPPLAPATTPPAANPVKVPEPVAAPSTPAPRPMGRPPGKRSDPGWRPKTILMRTQTHRRVSAVLIERDNKPDLSELVDELLSKWLAEQR